MYGADKVEQIEREKETQNYIILSLNELDDDTAIENFSKTATFARDKRIKPVASTPTPAANPSPADEQVSGPNIISFSSDDFN